MTDLRITTIGYYLYLRITVIGHYRVAANREATEPRVPFGKVEVITSKMLRKGKQFLLR
jgi:hypothetical protein